MLILGPSEWQMQQRKLKINLKFYLKLPLNFTVEHRTLVQDPFPFLFHLLPA